MTGIVNNGIMCCKRMSVARQGLRQFGQMTGRSRASLRLGLIL